MMKALSILQPYAYLLAIGVKTTETRSYNTTHRGHMLIHASKGKPTRKFMQEYATSEQYAVHRHYAPDLLALDYGAIIGSANVDDCVTFGINKFDTTATDYALGDFRPMRKGFLCSSPVLFKEAIRCSGNLGIWRVNQHWSFTITPNRSRDILGVSLNYYGKSLKVFPNEDAAQNVMNCLSNLTCLHKFPAMVARMQDIEKEIFK